MPAALPPRPTGSSPEARFAQWVWDSLAYENRMQEVPGAAVVSRSTRGKAVIPLKQGGGGSRGVQQLRLIRVEDDYLVCHPLLFQWVIDGDHPDGGFVEREVATNVFVAKVYDHRQTPFDGATVTYQQEFWDDVLEEVWTKDLELSYDYKSPTFREVTDADSNKEFEVIIPRYHPGAKDPDDNDADDVFTTIYATPAGESIGVSTSSDSDIEANEWERNIAIMLLDDNRDGRSWMRQSSSVAPKP